MKKYAPLTLTGLVALLFLCSFANPTPKNDKKVRTDDTFMIGFEVFRTDDTPLNHTDLTIEIYDHRQQKTIALRDYSKMKTNRFSSITHFENLAYGNDLTFLIRAPNYYAKEITISYDEFCTDVAKFCIDGLNEMPYDINGIYADRYLFPVVLDSIEVGKEIVLPNIYYEYNSAQLQQKSLWVLDSLSKVIQHHPELKIALGGHADARGGDAYNLSLSDRRVQAVRQYLAGKLTPETLQNITATGYGETRLVNDCDNGVSCPESLHQQNRRTTFTIEEIDSEVAVLSLEERMQTIR